MFRRACVAGILGMSAALRSPAVAAEIPGSAAETFNSLYAADLTDVLTTPTFEDDLALAQRFLKAAKASNAERDLIAILCDHAFDLARKEAAGYDTAVEALRYLGQRFPEQRYGCAQRLIPIYEAEFKAASQHDRKQVGAALIQQLLICGDCALVEANTEAASSFYRRGQGFAAAIRDQHARRELQDHILRLREDEATYRKIATLKKTLQQDPANRSAGQELVSCYMIGLDSPAEAAKYSSLADAPTQEILRLATAGRLDATGAMKLGDWYAAAAFSGRSDAVKAAMNRRAAQYYRFFQKLHPKHDVTWAKAEAFAKRSETRSAGAILARDTSSGQGWTNLMLHADLTRDAIAGRWAIADGYLSIAATARAKLQVAVEPHGDYEFELEFAIDGGAAAMMFPVADRALVVEVGGTDARQGQILELDGAPMVFDLKQPLLDGEWYRLTVRVQQIGTEAQIVVSIDDRDVARWSGPASAASAPSAWSLPDKHAIGVGASAGKLQVRNIRLRMLSGDAKYPQDPRGGHR